MKPAMMSPVLAAWAYLLIPGCNGDPAAANPDLGGPNELITWLPPEGKDRPLPGIDEGTVYLFGRAFVFWSDARGGGGGTASSNVQGAQCQGSVRAREGRRIEFACQTKDGKTGRVTINKGTYDLAKGNVFLVSTTGDRVEVKQLKRNLDNLKAERDSLEAFARNDHDIAEFFAKAMKPK